MSGLIVLLVTFALMWALFILPQQRRVRQHQSLVQSLGPGDEVVTAGGVIGEIVGIVDDTVILRVADGVELRLLRGAISRRLEEPSDADAVDVTEADELDLSDDGGLPAGPAEQGGTWPLAGDDDPGRAS